MTDVAPSEAPAKRRRPRNAADTQQKILAAARVEFARHGFAGARMDRIIKRAGTNPRMIYHYFGSKEGLYVTVLEEALGDLRREELKIDVEHLAPLEGLMQLFDFMGSHFESNAHLVRLLTNENIERARYLKNSKRVQRTASPVLNNIAALLARGAADGTLRSGLDPLEVYVMMVALNQFHLSNVHTLSAIFDKDLSAADWRASRHKAAQTMVAAFLSAS